ncbi:MAG: hypothetical protein H7Y02_06550 [Candidatus Obscuribacterales bacterium]|nr:hypothetical protein [Steroidobacteraceae bacterium]
MSNVLQIPIGLNVTARPTIPRQNWVLTPTQDALFVIFAPLLVLAAALIAFRKLGAAEATSLIVVAHIVMTVAHHLPTFIRIYGDVDLVKRFKWSFVLGPVIPLVFSIGVLIYINAHDYPVEYFLYLYIMLALWDPWHFLRQHYGFMRVYDRANAAPKQLAAKMDLWLCVVWFTHIMLASGAWLPEMLHDLYASTNIPIALTVSAAAIGAAAAFTQVAAIVMTLIYGGYLFWCWKKHFYISAAKLALFLLTFGVMYLTYTPNEWILSVAPGWTFKVGFAAIGIVHMTQYLAIVWRYNRSLSASAERSRAGLFRRWHAKGGWLLGIAYIVVCLFYGEVVTTQRDNRWLMSVLLAIGFTSTLMHYYFDGFIWKVRHQQNRDALAMRDDGASSGEPAKQGSSWWSAAKQLSPQKMFARQLLYFGVPMTLLTLGATAAWQTQTNYIHHMYGAQTLASRGLNADAAAEARLAYAAMNRQLPFAQKMVELQPTAAREAELAFLLYNQSLYEHVVMPQLAGERASTAHTQSHRDNIEEAITLLAGALRRGDSLTHNGREKLTALEAQQVLASWRRRLE